MLHNLRFLENIVHQVQYAVVKTNQYVAPSQRRIQINKFKNHMCTENEEIKMNIWPHYQLQFYKNQ